MAKEKKFKVRLTANERVTYDQTFEMTAVELKEFQDANDDEKELNMLVDMWLDKRDCDSADDCVEDGEFEIVK